MNFQTLSPLMLAVTCSERKNSAMRQLTNVLASHKCKKLKIDFQNHRYVKPRVADNQQITPCIESVRQLYDWYDTISIMSDSSVRNALDSHPDGTWAQASSEAIF